MQALCPAHVMHRMFAKPPLACCAPTQPPFNPCTQAFRMLRKHGLVEAAPRARRGMRLPDELGDDLMPGKCAEV